MKHFRISYNIDALIMKLIFSMIIAGIMALLVDTVRSKSILFIIFTALIFLSIQSGLKIFTTSITVFLDKIITDLHAIQKEYTSSDKLSFEKKEILKYKFLHVRGVFLKDVLNLQFLRNNKYCASAEIEDLIAIAKKTVQLYTKDMMNEANIKPPATQFFIDKFHEIHNPATEKFIKEVSDSIINEKLVWDRRRIFYNGLINLMASSAEHFLEISIPHDYKGDEEQ